MAANMNLPRKPGLGEYATNTMPMDYNSMGMNKTASNIGMPLSVNALGDATMTNQGPGAFPQNHFSQGMNNFGAPSRQFQDNLESMARMKYTPNTNMAASSGSLYGGVFDTNSSEPYQLAMARKFRPRDVYAMNKNMEQSNFTQQRNMASNPWPIEYVNRSHSLGLSRQRSMPVNKAGLSQQGRVDTNLGASMPADQNFPSPIGGGSSPQAYQLPAPYMVSDMFKQSSVFAPRGVSSNFNPQDFYQQEQLRQMANFQQGQLPHVAKKYITGNQRNSPSPYGHSALPKPNQDPMYSQQFSGSPKTNGPHNMIQNMVDERQIPFPSANYPVSPVGSQMAGKPTFSPSMNLRGTVSPNVTIGMPKKQPYRPQEEAVTSPVANQNAAAAAAAAAVLAAVNTANPNSKSDVHNVSARPPSVSNIPSRPPSIHAKDPRSPSTSIISDHRSESGGSGINDIRMTPSPARSISRNTPQMSEPTSVINFSDVETGRVPSPSVNELPSSDIEAMIHSVSNVPGGVLPLSKQPIAPDGAKSFGKSEPTSKINQESASPFTPPSPFSLSPSTIDVNFDIDMLSPTPWGDSSSRSSTPLSKLYKLSEEPERKDFLDKLVLLMEQQGKTFHEVPNFCGSILDLFKFYQLVSKRGGMQEVTRLKLWKDVAQGLANATTTNEDVQLLKEYYIRLLLTFEEKFGVDVFQHHTSLPPTSVPNPPANDEAGNIDLSTLTYKTLFQANSNAPTTPYNQGTGPSMRPALYPSAPPTTQGYPSTPPIQQLSGYRNAPAYPQTQPGYPNYSQGSPRLPSYPTTHPSYSNHQFANFQGHPSQVPAYHNGMHPSRFANYPRNAGPPDAMYGQFSRGPGLNKPFQQDPQSQGVFANYQQQGQHPPGYMYQQQTSNLATYQMERQRAAQRSGMGSPRPRMQSPWAQRYQDGAGSSTGSPSPFHNSQSPGPKPSRPPPPYPHPKQEKPSPTPQSAAAALQFQAMKAGGVKLSSAKKEEEEVFPPGCVEATMAVYSKKRRLTARDIGPVEAWRIMMSLKSGLLTETAWALDTLTILLSDDATVGFFRLAHLPGFLDTVVEHFRRSLINVFGVLRDGELATGIPARFAYGGSTLATTEKQFCDVLPDQIATDNFSSIIIAGCLADEEDTGFTSGTNDWLSGGGDTTIHIQTHFETDPFFYENKKSDNCCRNLPENTVTEGKPVECSSETEEKVDSHVSKRADCTETTQEKNIARRSKNATVQVQEEVNDLFNGIPSPDMHAVRKSVITTDPGVFVKQEKSEFFERQQNYCNGERDGSSSCKNDYGIGKGRISSDERGSSVEKLRPGTSVVKVEPGCSSSENDTSALLIKRLRAELDLDVDSVSQDSEEITNLGEKSCDMNCSSPTDRECELNQEFPLSSVTLSQDAAVKTCDCLSNIIRNLSFIPGNDVEMAKNPSLLLLFAKLLLLHHMKRNKGLASDSQYNDTDCWWQDCLDSIRENVLVSIANIAGYLDLSPLAGNLSRLLLEGLIHWLVCQSAVADEPLRSTSASVLLTPKQLVLETLAKMSVLESNVDFILSSPNKAELVKVYEYLVKLFSDKSNEVTREFALVLLSSFTQANQEICSKNSERNLVTVLVGFLEDARDRVESMAVRGLHPGMFRDNDLRVSMGMLRRAGSLLACIAKRTRGTHFIPFQERILALSMSRALDAEVQSHLSNVLYNLPR